jgi:hypothetical protein
MQQPAHMGDRPSRTAQWYGLLAAPGAFGVMATLAFAIAPTACQLGLMQFQIAGTTGLALIMFVLALGAVVVGISGGVVAFRNRLRAQRGGARPHERSDFLAVGGIMLSVLFVGLSIVYGLSLLSFRPCNPV